MVLRLFKYLAIFISIYIGFMIYSYLWGPMYGGRKYTHKTHIAHAVFYLKKYHEQQQEHFVKYGSYDTALSSLSNIEVDVAYKFITSVDQNACSDCGLRENEYKVVIVGKHNDDVVMISLDSRGCIADEQEKKNIIDCSK